MRYPRRDDGVPRWALVIEYNGRSVAWTSDGQQVSGLSALVVGAVEVPDVADRIDLSGADVREAVSLSLPWFDEAQPKDVQGSAAVLALVPSAGWGERYVLIDGVVTVTELDRPNALIGIEIAAPDTSGGEWPPASWAVSDQTFVESTIDPLATFPAFLRPALGGDVYTITVGPDPAHIGKGYPVPYGRTSVGVPAYELPIVERHANANNSQAEVVLLAGGVLPSVDFDLLYVADEIVDDSGIASPVATPRIDALGQAITTVDVHTASNSARNSKQWYATITSNASPTPTAGAGHIAAWLLSKTQAVDLTWSGEALARSTGLEIGGFIDEPVQPLAWVQDRITGRLPIATARSPRGKLRLVWVPYVSGDIVDTLTDGLEGVLRSGSVSEQGKQDTQRVEVRFRLDVHRDEYTKTLTAQDGPSTASMQTEVIEADDVHTEATAAAVAQFALWRKRYRRTVNLDAPTTRVQHLYPGAVIRYTDADLGITDVPHVVLSVVRTDRPFTSIEITPV